MAEYQGREQLEAWMRERPREVSVVIAARAALRVLPMLLTRPMSDGYRRDVILPVFRATELPWSALRYSIDSDKLPNAARSAADAADGAVATFSTAISAAAEATRAAADVADATFSAAISADATFSSSNSAAASVEAVSFAYRSVSHVTISAAISSDMTMLEIMSDTKVLVARTAQLIGRKLWPGRTPGWAINQWNQFKGALLAIPDENWQVWTDWYDARLKGRPANQAHELARALLPEEVWKQGPKGVNAAIAGIVGSKAETAAPNNVPPPILPIPGPGVTFGERDQILDLDPVRTPDEPELTKRDQTLIAEAREAAQDFLNSFSLPTNTHAGLRGIARRYLDQVSLDDPDIDLVFALGLRLQNHRDEAAKQIANELEPSLEASQREALKSLTQINAVVIAASKRGAELLALADRYAFGKTDDLAFQKRAEQVVAKVELEQFLATPAALDTLAASVAMINTGDHTHRGGLMGRNTIQRGLLSLSEAAIKGVVGTAAGQIFVHTAMGTAFIASGASFSDKSIHFLLQHATELRLLAASAPEGFGFLNELLDWLKLKLGL